jgi:hypothetical protein
MTRNYLFLLFFCASFLNSTAQSNCSSAQAYIVYALSHSESALDANNVTHAKHFANKAKEAFKKVQTSLKDCKCDQVDDFVYEAINYLAKAKTAEKIEDAYFYANKGKKLAEATIENLDLCTAVNEDVIETTPEPDTNTQLSSIEYEQEQLKQQQRALELKQAELQQKIAQKKEQETSLKKEELILKMEATVDNTIKTFNEALSACDCNSEMLSTSTNTADLVSQSIEDIRLSFIDTIKALSADYTLKLADCKE